MSDYKPITGELREKLAEYEPQETGDAFVARQVGRTGYDAMIAMCDRIDAIHAGLEREYAELREREGDWIKLPVDADGLPWHLGDVTESGQTIKGMGLNRHGWHFVGTVNEIDPAIHRHHRPDTWESIISDAIHASESDELGSGSYEQAMAALVARCKKLAGDVS